MLELSDTNFEATITTGKPVIVDFHATWCGPCKKLAPIFEKVSERLKDSISFVKADIDVCEKAAVAHSIEGVPTIIIFKDGKPKARKSGVPREEDLETWIKSNL